MSKPTSAIVQALSDEMRDLRARLETAERARAIAQADIDALRKRCAAVQYALNTWSA